MAKFDHHKLSPQEYELLITELIGIVRAAASDKAMRQLLVNLLTHSEVVMIGRRILIAERLLQGKTVQEIRQELKVGFTTIATVQRWLERDGKKPSLKLPNRISRRKRSYREPHIIGSPEHGVSILTARMGLLGFLLEGFDYLVSSKPSTKK